MSAERDHLIMGIIRAMLLMLAAILFAALAGCATNASLKHPEETSFVALECYSASLIYKIFTGGVDGCRVISHNMILSESALSVGENGKFSGAAETVAD